MELKLSRVILLSKQSITYLLSKCISITRGRNIITVWLEIQNRLWRWIHFKFEKEIILFCSTNEAIRLLCKHDILLHTVDCVVPTLTRFSNKIWEINP